MMLNIQEYRSLSPGKNDCPSGATVTRAYLSIGRYVHKVILHSADHAEPVVSQWRLAKAI